jgi:glycosyltransferase involved in cell wall biosynthesis
VNGYPLSDKIRIMHVTGWLDIGGVEELLMITAKYNLKHKFDLAFVTCRTTNGFTSCQIKEMGYPVYGLNISTKVYDIRLIPKLIKAFKDYRPHIVHLYTKLNVLGRIAAQLSGVPIVVCNEIDMGWEGYGYGLKIIAGLKRKLDFLTDKIIDCSEAVKRYWDIEKSGKHQVIYLPLDIMTFQKAVSETINNKFKNGKHPVLGVVSRVYPGKGHEYLIEAMVKIHDFFPSAKLKIVGTGPLLDEMKDLAKSLNIDKYIEFTGFVENLYEELFLMDIFILPSLSEGFPICIMEAMALGIPVAATPIGGVPELINHDETGLLFPTKDPTSLAEAVITMLSDFDYAKQLGERGRQKVIDEHTPEVYINKLDLLYQELLQTKKII